MKDQYGAGKVSVKLIIFRKLRCKNIRKAEILYIYLYIYIYNLGITFGRSVPLQKRSVFWHSLLESGV
jgi:hypothetical protein